GGSLLALQTLLNRACACSDQVCRAIDRIHSAEAALAARARGVGLWRERDTQLWRSPNVQTQFYSASPTSDARYKAQVLDFCPTVDPHNWLQRCVECSGRGFCPSGESLSGSRGCRQRCSASRKRH